VNRIIAAAALSLAFVAGAPAIAGDAPSTPVTTVVPTKGKMLVAADGARLAPIYRIGGDGPQIILDGRMVTIPGNTVALVDGKLTTTLSKAQVIALP
jgi:hypothetical protein